ncbi:MULTISPECIES: hypothetical protein [unclassified Streptomyces]|uniref:hypothetical protein n=1 Tax=unclassified Streptomyces TaxID=2593676 RepID=UPI001CB70C71|nr:MULTISPECIES: hypothetical protein [unclassified Streptomyces]MBD0711129.1 hypothetical protein [Streptomyces sp. CBMA291]MBD0714160.1 hypothetical protein [Streptomyces sp. CBMA370]
MHVLRRTTVATTVMLAAISLGACSTSGPASDSAKEKAPIDQANWPAEKPTSGLVKGLELPLESYLSSYADQVAVDTALRTLQTRCMSEYGLTVDLPRPGANPPPYSNAVSIERRYGLSDRAQAQKYGYGLPKELTRSLESAEEGLSDIEVEVLTGRKKPEFAPPAGATGAKGADGHFGGVPEPARAEHNGKKLHEGGCAGWSKRRLKVNEGDAGFVSGLASTSLSESRPLKPVEKALKSWSACMKDKGRKAADPYRAMEQGYADGNGDGTTKNAIELALDDIDCKEQTRLIEVWFKEESAVQKRLIEENKDQLAAIKKRMGEVLAAAKAVK